MQHKPAEFAIVSTNGGPGLPGIVMPWSAFVITFVETAIVALRQEIYRATLSALKPTNGVSEARSCIVLSITRVSELISRGSAITLHTPEERRLCGRP